jgi:hypothetical protein
MILNILKIGLMIGLSKEWDVENAGEMGDKEKCESQHFCILLFARAIFGDVWTTLFTKV